MNVCLFVERQGKDFAPVYVWTLINPTCCSEGEIPLFLLTHILESSFFLHCAVLSFKFSHLSPRGGWSEPKVRWLSVIQ